MSLSSWEVGYPGCPFAGWALLQVRKPQPEDTGHLGAGMGLLISLLKGPCVAEVWFVMVGAGTLVCPFPFIVDTVWEMMTDLHRTQLAEKKLAATAQHRDTEKQGMSQPGQRQLQLPVRLTREIQTKPAPPQLQLAFMNVCLHSVVSALSQSHGL